MLSEERWQEDSPMSTLTTPTTAWQWPPDVVDFAKKNKVDTYLDPLLNLLRDIFPTARSWQVLLKQDPEIRDDSHIVFDVRIAAPDVPDFLAAQRRWYEESFRICPAPLAFLFCLILVREDS